MSDKKNEKNSVLKKKAEKKDFEDFEEAFFNEGDFQLQEAETGSYMVEDFGTDIWEDFALPLESPDAIPITVDTPPLQKERQQESDEEEKSDPKDDTLDESFDLEGFSFEDISVSPVQAFDGSALVEVEEIDDFSLDDFDALGSDVSQMSDATIQIPMVQEKESAARAEPIETKEESQVQSTLVQEDFGLTTLEEDDDFFDFEFDGPLPVEKKLESEVVNEKPVSPTEKNNIISDDFILDDIEMDMVMEDPNSTTIEAVQEEVRLEIGSGALVLDEAKKRGELSLFIEAAQVSYIRKEPEVALDALMQVPKSTPKNKDYYHLLLLCAYDSSDIRVFRDALSGLLPLVSPKERSVLFVMSATLSQSHGSMEDVQAALTQAVQEDSEHVYAYMMLRENSKKLGRWSTFVEASKELAQASSPAISSIFLQSAAEVSFERLHEQENALELLSKSCAHQGRVFAKLMTRLGWPDLGENVKERSLPKLYSACVHYKNQNENNIEHPTFRWVNILNHRSPEQIENLQKNNVFAENTEGLVTKLLLARATQDVSHVDSVILTNPSILFGVQSNLNTVGEAQKILMQCTKGVHGQATHWAILQDLYRTVPSTNSTATPKMGRSWLGIRKGSMSVDPSNTKEIFEFPHADVIQELWYIHLSMKSELEQLYVQRANEASDPKWKAYWMFQAGIVQNKRAYFVQARTHATDIPLGYTREYIAAWKEWQFGQGAFHTCIELLEKQAQLCELPAYHVAVSLLKGKSTIEHGFGGLRVISNMPADISRTQLTEYMNKLTAHEQQYLSLIVLLSNPTPEQCAASFAYAPQLPMELLFALGVSSFDIDSQKLYSLLDTQLGDSVPELALRIALLFCRNNEQETKKAIQGMDCTEIREEISILAEICGMANIAKEYAANPEDVFGALRPHEAAKLFEERLEKEPHPYTVLNLLEIQEDSIVGYKALLALSKDTSLTIGVHSRLASLLVRNKQSDLAIPHLKAVFDMKPSFGLNTKCLVEQIYASKQEKYLASMAHRCPEIVDEVSLRLIELEAWDEALGVLMLCTPKLVQDFRMESIQEGREEWHSYYELLKKRMTVWQSERAKSDAQERCARVMLEYLADKPYTLVYYQKKAQEAPNNKEVLEALSRIAIAQGDIQGGIQTLTSLYDQASSSPQAAQYLFRIAQALNGDGRRLPAIDKLKQALDVHPVHTQARALLKELLYQGQYTDSLIQVLEQEISLTQGEEKVTVMIELAALYRNVLNDYDRAMNIWSKIWHNDEQNLEALTQLIEIAKSASSEEQLVQYMQEMQARSPSADRIIEIADRLEALGKKKLYEQSLLDATDFSQVRLVALQRLGSFYKSQQNSEKYSQTMLSIVEETSEKEEKIQILEQVLSENEQSIRSPEELFRICSMIEKLNPNHERSLLFISEYHYQAGEFALSIPYFSKVFAQKKQAAISSFEGRMSYSDLLFRYANALQKENQQSESISVLQDLLEMIPYHLQALRLIGPMLVEKGELSQAAQVYKSLLMNVGSESPESLPLYLELGDIEVERGNNEQAIQYFVRAFRMQPENLRAMISLARLCVQLKRWNKALQLYQKLLSTRGVSKTVMMEGMLVKAWILDRTLGMYDIAYKHLEQSLQYESNQPIVLLCMAEMQYRKQSYTQALSSLEKMMALEECAYHRLALLLKSSCLEHEDQQGEAHAIQEFLKVSSEERRIELEQGFARPLF